MTQPPNPFRLMEAVWGAFYGRSASVAFSLESEAGRWENCTGAGNAGSGR